MGKTYYKGFDKNLQCRDFQYEIGKEYNMDGDIKCCENGFHACENPFDVFGYYVPDGNSRFCEVECSGKESHEEDSDSKAAFSHIKIVAEIGITGIIKAGVKFILDKVDWKNSKQSEEEQSAATNTGYRSAATNTGYRSAATNTGDWSAATNTGYRSAATNTGDCSAATNTGDWSSSNVSGKDSIAISVGTHARAKGSIGDWLVLADRDPETYEVRNMRCILVDGKDIREDTWYSLDGDSVVETSESFYYKEPMNEDDIRKLKEKESE